VSNSDAFHHLNEAQKYLWQLGNNSFDEVFMKLQNIVTENTFNNLRQTKIIDFFK
jgi:hypothetical protein